MWWKLESKSKVGGARLIRNLDKQKKDYGYSYVSLCKKSGGWLALSCTFTEFSLLKAEYITFIPLHGY